MFLRVSLKIKFVMLRSGPGPKVGVHLVPDRYFPSLTLCMGFPEGNSVEFRDQRQGLVLALPAQVPPLCSILTAHAR